MLALEFPPINEVIRWQESLGLRVVTDGVAIGPILMGISKPVHILTTSATPRRVVNMTAIAAVDAQIRAQLEAEKASLG